MCSPSELEHAKDTTTQSLPNVESIVPKTKVSQTAYEHASSNLHPAILNHSLRVFVYAKALSQHYASAYFSDPAKLDLLFTACLFHDIGTASIYNGSQRFEVEGGDAAVKHLSQFDVSDTDKHDVWTSIAIHTSPGIAERIGELSKILRVAITTDFGRSTPDDDTLAPLRENLERDFARHAIEKVLGDAVVEQAKAKPEKAPMVSWPGVLYRAWLAEPDWEGVNKSF